MKKKKPTMKVKVAFQNLGLPKRQEKAIRCIIQGELVKYVRQRMTKEGSASKGVAAMNFFLEMMRESYGRF